MRLRRRVIVLRNERRGRDTRHLSATLDRRGVLTIEGHDLGPGTSPVSDDGEYEYFHRIEKKDVPRLVRELGGAPGDDIINLLESRYTGGASYELERIVGESDIDTHFWCWP